MRKIAAASGFGSQRGSATTIASAGASSSTRAEARQREHLHREQRRGDHDRGERHAIDVVEVEPEEQQVAAEQRAEQRADGVPRVQLAGGGAEVADLALQVVEDQR